MSIPAPTDQVSEQVTGTKSKALSPQAPLSPLGFAWKRSGFLASRGTFRQNYLNPRSPR